MKKAMFTLLTAFAAVALVAAQTTTTPGTPLVIKHSNGTVTIDGQAADDEPWGIAEDVTVGVRVPNEYTDAFNAKFKMIYDESNIYVLVTVNDPNPGKMHSATWQSDCVELFFAMDTADTSRYREKGDWQLRIRSAEDYAVVDSLDGNHGPGNSWNVSGMKSNPNFKVGFTLTGNTYVMEWQLPLDTLVQGNPNFNGKYFRFDIQVSNNEDGSGGRKGQLFWNSGANDQYEKVKNQGYVKFEWPLSVKPAIAKASSIRIKANSIEFAKTVKEVNVYSITGQLMLKARNVNAISTSALKSGVYFVVADGEKAKFVIK
ncbi:MAG: sugar-binding protein [Bacteroidales bacterium]